MENTVRFWLVVAVAVSGAGAVETTEEMMDMPLDDLMGMNITVAGAKAENIFKTVSVVSVVDRATIERYNFTSVAEALETVAGMTVMRTYLKRDIPTIRGILQDHYANKVLVLINGVPAWNAVTGEASLNRVDINSVERIEVLKGPGSVLYGTNAFMGAVNIVLRDTEKDGVGGRVNGRVGSAGAADAGAALSFKKGSLSVMATGSAADEDGHEYEFTGEAETFDPITQTTQPAPARQRTATIDEYSYANSANVLVKYRFLSLLFNTYRSHESYLGVTPTFRAGAGSDHYATGYLGNLGIDHEFATWLRVKYALSYDWQERDLSRTWNDSIRASLEGKRIASSLDLLSEPFKNFTIQLGGNVDYRISSGYRNYLTATDSVVDRNNMANREVYEYSGLLQLGYTSDHFTALVGGRVTKSELFDPNWAARVTLVGQINERNSVKAIVGQSYRSPSLFEQYFYNAGTVTGSEDLDPEKCLSAELLYMGQHKWFFGQVLGYWAQVKNRIYRAPNPAAPPPSVYDNGSKFNAWGGELELKFDHPKLFSAFVNYALTMGDSGDADTLGNYNFQYVPMHTVTAGVSRSIGPAYVSAVGNGMSSAQMKNGEYIQPQFTIDVAAGFRHDIGNARVRHQVSAKNITDADVQYPEYSRPTNLGVTSVPSGYGRRVSYELSVEL